MISEFSKGNILIASPIIPDVRFANSVILVCEVKSTGSFGIIINQQAKDKKLKDFLEDKRFNRCNFFSGGPVDSERGFIIHSNETKWKNTLKLSQEVCITTLEDAISQESLTKELPENFMIAMGYTNWLQGQLEHEIKSGFWIPIQIEIFDLLFKTNPINRWNLAFQKAGINRHTLSPYIGLS